MATYISLLRGINVSGHRNIKMDDLKKIYTSLGFLNVASYIQSGNLVFNHKKIDCKKLENIIETEILKVFKFDVPVIISEFKEFKNIVNNNPYLNDKLKIPTHFYFTFLAKKPDEIYFNTINTSSNMLDECKLIDKTIYLFCPNGYGTTKLNNTYFENKLKTKATSRNYKTIIEILKLAEDNYNKI